VLWKKCCESQHNILLCCDKSQRNILLCCELSQHNNMLCCRKCVFHNTTYCCVVTAFICRLALVGHRMFTHNLLTSVWGTREMLICKHWTSNSQTSATTTCLVDSMHKLWFLLRFCAVYYCSFCIPCLLEYYLSCLQNLVYIEHSCTCSGGKPADTYSDVTLHCWQK